MNPFIIAVLVLSAYRSGADAHTLRVRVQPGRGSGGEPFLEQPQVEILEGEGGDIDIFFEVSKPTASNYSDHESLALIVMLNYEFHCCSVGVNIITRLSICCIVCLVLSRSTSV